MQQPPAPKSAALYARVSSERQDVDLSVAAQLRALRNYAESNGYLVAREYIDEAESGRVADRPQFRKMLDAASGGNAPFEEILVWKFSRFTRKREHAVAFKSMLRRRGVRVVSITEHADDSPTGKLMEAIIESVDEFYSENLAQEVVRGMREAASRGFFLSPKAPFGYTRVKVRDGLRERPTLEVDPAAAPLVREIFESSLRGNGLKEICRDLNERGITKNGKRWQKNGLYYLLTNEAYTGTAVWGRTTKGEKAPDPVRVEGAWKALVSKELFDKVQQVLRQQRRVELPTTEEIKGYVADFRSFLCEGTVPERKALIRNFVKGIEVTGNEARLTYTIPMPSDGVISEEAPVLDFVQSGLPPLVPAFPHVSADGTSSAVTGGAPARGDGLPPGARGYTAPTCAAGTPPCCGAVRGLTR